MNMVIVNLVVHMGQYNQEKLNALATRALVLSKFSRAALGTDHLDSAKNQRAPISHIMKSITSTMGNSTLSRVTFGVARTLTKRIRRVI